MYDLKIIIASTRPLRRGIIVANWVVEEVKKYTEFQVEILDLDTINLPFLDEPKHPRFQQYTHEHTKRWSEKINAADAFVVIIPEYNYSMPPTLLNAIDFVYKEWNYKPVGIVSYGGISGGLRSAQVCKEVMTTVKMVPLAEGVALPFFEKRIVNEVFQSDELVDKSVQTMMRELEKWTKALKPMRSPDF